MVKMRGAIVVAALAVLFPTSFVLAPPAGSQSAPAVTEKRDIPYASGGGRSHLLDAFIPSNGATDRPGVIFVHGGGWTIGGKTRMDTFAQQIASQTGWVGFSISYTLKPPRYPAEWQDVAAAVTWVRDHAKDFGVDPKKLGVVGSSSGGNIAQMAAFYGKGSLTTGSRVRAVVTWSGPSDLKLLVSPSTPCTTQFWCRKAQRRSEALDAYLECSLTQCPQKYQEASPVTYVDPSDPPILLANSQDELVPIDGAEEMAQRLKQNGVPYDLHILPGQRHATAYAPDIWAATVQWLGRYMPHEPPRHTPSPTPSGSHFALPPPTGSSGPSRGLIAVIAIGAGIALLILFVALARRPRGKRPSAGAGGNPPGG